MAVGWGARTLTCTRTAQQAAQVTRRHIHGPAAVHVRCAAVSPPAWLACRRSRASAVRATAVQNRPGSAKAQRLTRCHASAQISCMRIAVELDDRRSDVRQALAKAEARSVVWRTIKVLAQTAPAPPKPHLRQGCCLPPASAARPGPPASRPERRGRRLLARGPASRQRGARKTQAKPHRAH